MSAEGGGGVEVTATPLLFSGLESVKLVAVAMLVKNVPGGVAGGMWKTNVRSTELNAARPPMTHVTVLTTSEQGPVAETNVIPAGTGSVTVMLPAAASSGPTLNTVTVYVTSLPAAACAGPAFETAMSVSWAQARDAPRTFARTARRTSRRSA